MKPKERKKLREKFLKKIYEFVDGNDNKNTTVKKVADALDIGMEKAYSIRRSLLKEKLIKTSATWNENNIWVSHKGIKKCEEMD